VRRIITSAIDLLAAMPSLLFGIWGEHALEGPITKLAAWFGHHLSVLPFFRLSSSQIQSPSFTGSTLQAGIVVGIMIIPIVTSVSRDVMAQVPRDQCEGALALGGTRWGMVRDVILPFGRSGIVGGILLGTSWPVAPDPSLRGSQPTSTDPARLTDPVWLPPA
jgi:phosphate transport system permease protein